MSSPRGRTLAALVLVFTTLLVGGTGAALAGTERPEPGSVGAGDSYFPEDGNGGIDVLRYRIADAYDFASGELSGQTTLTVRATEALSSFDLDLLLPVSAVTVDGAAAAFSRPDAHELRITPAQPIARGATFTATVAYDGYPARLCWQRECDWLADAHEVTAMNEPHMAAWWFAADDTPADAAVMDISITTPADKTVVANGRQVSRTVSGDLATTRWAARDPMAPYLAFFTAGDYTVEHGTVEHGPEAGLPWLIAVSDQLPPASRASSLRLMRETPAITSWLAGRLGPYPFETVGGVTTALDPGFALENQTRPTYPVLAAERTVTVVHELSHQWFGDSVRLARWRDVWLNEGFATFMEWAWEEAHGGRSALSHLLSDRALLPASFWTTRVDAPGAGHLWTRQVYQRGGLTLEALRNRVGDRTFWRILRGWARTRAGRTGTTEQFERYAEQVSHQRLGGFFTAWLDTPARPARTAANGLIARG